MADISTILQHIRENVIDVGSEAEDRLLGWVHDAQRELEAAYQWRVLETAWLGETTEGIDYLSQVGSGDYRPDNWIKAIGDPWYRSGLSGATMRMEWLPTLQDTRKEHPQSPLTSSYGPPSGLTVSATDIWVYPMPDSKNPIGAYSSAGEYQIVVPYLARATTLALTGAGKQSNVFTDLPGLQLYLEDYVSAKAMIFNRDLGNAQIYFAQSQAHLLREKRLDKSTRAQYIKLTPRRDVHASRKQRRAF